MAGRAKGLTRLQEQAIAALLTEKNLADAAARCGASVSSLLRWAKEKAFADAYRAARRAVLEAAIARMQSAAGEAVDVLRQALGTDRPADRIRAAVALLDHAIKGAELLDLAERVA